MTDHPIKREFDEAYGLVEGKAHDYAEDDNVFSNFEFAAQAAGVTVEQVFLVLIGVKVARLGQLVGNDKQPNNESIDDTVLDGMNYFGLMKAYMRGLRPDTLRDIFDEFARAELNDGPGFEFNRSGLIDAVMNDPMRDGWGGPDSCGDPNCCGGEEEDDSDFLDAQVEDGKAIIREDRELPVWRKGDPFMLTDQRVFEGYGDERQVVEILESAGPYIIGKTDLRGVTFMVIDREMTATWNEIERL